MTSGWRLLISTRTFLTNAPSPSVCRAAFDATFGKSSTIRRGESCDSVDAGRREPAVPLRASRSLCRPRVGTRVSISVAAGMTASGAGSRRPATAPRRRAGRRDRRELDANHVSHAPDRSPRRDAPAAAARARSTVRRSPGRLFERDAGDRTAAHHTVGGLGDATRCAVPPGRSGDRAGSRHTPPARLASIDERRCPSSRRNPRQPDWHGTGRQRAAPASARARHQRPARDGPRDFISGHLGHPRLSSLRPSSSAPPAV